MLIYIYNIFYIYKKQYMTPLPGLAIRIKTQGENK